MARIAPSLLAADLSDLWSDVQQVSSVELLHLDVMDGCFVPNISFGTPVVSSLRRRTDLYFDTHLMIERPTRYLDDFAEAGADRITVHAEASADPDAIITRARGLGVDVGIAINPDTRVSEVKPLLDRVDVVLVMGVEPGFTGQEFIEGTVEKIAHLNELTATEIEVDGGINRTTGSRCVEAGADTLVIGSSLFGHRDVTGTLVELRSHLCK